MAEKIKMVGFIKKAIVKYLRKNYPGEAKAITEKAEKLYPELYAKAPYIGGRENLMSHNLDMMITVIAFYEASDHRIDGPTITKIAGELFDGLGFVRAILNVNRPWQMKLLKSVMYKRYVPYSELVKEKKASGEWNNTWGVEVNPRNIDEGVSFDLVGCPLSDYAKANGYTEILPYMCAIDHMTAKLFHAKLIRTHTCATGSGSCDYWYIADEGETAAKLKDVKVI